MFTPICTYNLTLGGGFKYDYVHPYLGKIPILTNIFSDGLKPPTSLIGSRPLNLDPSPQLSAAAVPVAPQGESNPFVTATATWVNPWFGGRGLIRPSVTGSHVLPLMYHQER